MEVDGGCHCGKVTYRARIDPFEVLVCHCTDCQVISGSAYRVVVFAAEADFEILTGSPKIYEKVAASGAKRALGFCPDCGSHLYATDAEGGKARTYGIRVGTIRQREALQPSAQYWCGSALSWVEKLGSVPRKD